MRRKTKGLGRRSGKTMSSRTRGRLRPNQGSVSTRDRSSTISRKPYGCSADQPLYEKAREQWKKAVRKAVNCDAAGTISKCLAIRDRWDQYQIYRAILQAAGRKGRDVVLWDDIAVNEDRSNDPRHYRPHAEGVHLWSGSNVDSSDTSAQGTNVTRIHSVRSHHKLIREESHARGSSLHAKTKEDELTRLWKGKRRHANVHGLGFVAVEKGTTNFIRLEFLGVEHWAVARQAN